MSCLGRCACRGGGGKRLIPGTPCPRAGPGGRAVSLCWPCAVPVLSLPSSRAGAGGSGVLRSLALLLDPQTPCCPCREMPFVWGQEQLCASRARPWASLMWPRGWALPHGPGTVALCSGQGCAGWLQDVPNASPRVCAHISGAGGREERGVFGPRLHSAPLSCPIFAPHVAGISRMPWKPPCPALGTGGCPKMPPRTCSAAALPQSTNQEAPQWGTGMGLGGWGHGRAW